MHARGNSEPPLLYLVATILQHVLYNTGARGGFFFFGGLIGLQPKHCTLLRSLFRSGHEDTVHAHRLGFGLGN
jgi:hypothetical protein